MALLLGYRQAEKWALRRQAPQLDTAKLSGTTGYNAACLHAVLLQQNLADEEQVIACLRRLVNNRESGLERPHDWISNDPDFAPLLRDGSPYQKIRTFREALERRDYPAKQTTEERPTGARDDAAAAWGGDRLAEEP